MAPVLTSKTPPPYEPKVLNRILCTLLPCQTNEYLFCINPIDYKSVVRIQMYVNKHTIRLFTLWDATGVSAYRFY